MKIRSLQSTATSGDEDLGRSYFWMGLALVLVVLITVVHYWTGDHAVAFHNIYRRLVYIPIVIGAFALGRWGGLTVAVAASVAYIPHAFFMEHGDPAPGIDKWLEIVLYLFIGELTGRLVHRQMEVQAALRRSLAERDVLEEQLIRAGKLSALGHLTAGLAHEIRNPLASIQGSAEALASEFSPDHRKHRMAQLLLKEIERLGVVVGDFLRFVRPVLPQTGPVDLHDLAQRVLEFAEQHTDGQAIALQVQTRPGELIVSADADQLNQVVLNLYLNARKALECSETPAITIRKKRRELAGRRYLCLGIGDNGPGIPEELREEIFNPYFTTSSDGTGLGLSISARILEAHDGFLDVDSRPGETTIWICLPEETR
ncbi:MAG: two-component system sensor histidine kinase NtrB [Bradymonadaceae bacterium]